MRQIGRNSWPKACPEFKSVTSVFISNQLILIMFYKPNNRSTGHPCHKILNLTRHLDISLRIETDCSWLQIPSSELSHRMGRNYMARTFSTMSGPINLRLFLGRRVYSGSQPIALPRRLAPPAQPGPNHQATRKYADHSRTQDLPAPHLRSFW